MKVLLALCIASVITVFADEDYCAPDLCAKGVVHVACNPNKGFAPNCDSAAKQIDLSGELKQMIVDLHNMRRSEVATGNLTGFPTASKMLEISWDDDLASIAGFNARTCVMKHDQCRSTKAHPYSGQNIAIFYHSAYFTDPKDAIIRTVDLWYDENQHCPPELVFQYGRTNPTVGHFTAMLQQKCGKIGCAITQYFQNKWYMTLVTCNYDYDNMIGEEVYTVGTPCSMCLGECSTKNPGLCV